MHFDAREHWQRVYSEKSPESVSWYQRVPARSISLIEAHRAPEGPCHVLDVGAGASTLVDHLLDAGCEPWLLDVSERALAVTASRLGARADRARFTVGDISKPLGEPPAEWADIWHDRAVFHFLTTEADVQTYAANLARVLKPGGTAIIATFAPDGPQKCSGLDVRRRDAAGILSALGASAGMRILDEQHEDHTTPWGAIQKFTWTVLRRDTPG